MVSVKVDDVEELDGQSIVGLRFDDTEGSARVGMFGRHLGSSGSSDPNHRSVVDPDMAEPLAWVDSQVWLRSSLGQGSAPCSPPSLRRRYEGSS